MVQGSLKNPSILPWFSSLLLVDGVWRKFRASKLDDWVYWASLLALSWVAYNFSTNDLDLQVAWHGWGPLDYVAHKLQPENFHRDWINGIKDQHYLWPMRGYYYLAKYLGVSPFNVMYPFMAVQIICFVGAIAYLTRLLFSDRLASLLASCLAVVSGLVGLNLARFGDGLGMTVLSYAAPWGFALTFIILALAQHFKQRVILCFVYLAITMYCHAGFALYALGFVCCWYLMHPSLCLRKDFLLGLGIFAVLIIPTLAPLLHAAGTNPSIPTKLWLTLTKIFSFHSYPASMKMFGDRAHVEMVPLLLFGAFSLILLRTLVNPLYRDKILWGYLGCMLATVAGVIFSDYYPVVAIIKLQPHRASAFITLLGGICLAGYLARIARGSDEGGVLLACLLWAYLLISRPGLAMIPLLLLLSGDFYHGWDIFRGISRRARTCAGIILLCLMSLVVYVVVVLFIMPAYGLQGAPNSWLNNMLSTSERTKDLLLSGGYFTTKASAWVIGGFLLLAAMLRVIHRLTTGYAAKTALPVLTAALILLLPTLVLQNRSATWSASYGQVAMDYLKVQLWASANTPHDSLFLTDPSHAYGWRDFSQRSSFGSAREWGFNSLFYSSTPERLQEGLRRLSFFAGDVTNFSEGQLASYKGINYSSEINPKIRAKFCSLSNDDLAQLYKQWKINYVVFSKRCRGTANCTLSVVYENNSYIVYALGN